MTFLACHDQLYINKLFFRHFLSKTDVFKIVLLKKDERYFYEEVS